MDAFERLKGFFVNRLKRLQTPRQPSDLAQLAKTRLQQQDQYVKQWLPLDITPPATTFLPIEAPQEDDLEMKVITGFTPIGLPEETATQAVTQKEEDKSDKYVEEIHKITKRLSPAVKIVDGKEYPLNGMSAQVVQHKDGPYQIEAVELEEAQVNGIRVAEDRNPIERCGDAQSITMFSFRGPNGVENRVRLFFVGDGVGSSAVGDYAAKILTSKAQEYIVEQVKTGNIKKVEALKDLIAGASAFADEYFHNIPEESFRKAYEEDIKNVSPLQQSGMLGNFEDKQKKGGLANSTLLALAVVDQPSQPEAPLNIFYQNGGDGGFDVSAGYSYENFCLPQDYQGGVAPEQISYSHPVKGKDFYQKLIGQWQFDRPKDGKFIVSLRTDGLDKLNILGKERSSREMLDLAQEISAAQRPVPILTQLADRVGDDVTYLIIKS